MSRHNKAEEKRMLIRQGAYRCFRDEGYHATTVDAICGRVGISKGSFYWHYESKQEVFIDILETWTREVMDELYDRFESTVVDFNYLQAITQALQGELHRGRAIAPLWFEFTVLARRDRQLQDALSKFYRRARTAIAEILRPVMEPRFDESELQSTAATIFGAYAGLIMQEVSDPDRANAKNSMTQFMHVVGHILSDGASARTTPYPLPPSKRKTGPSKKSPPPHSDVAQLMKPFSQEVRKLCHDIRGLILETAPTLTERVVTGWRVIVYKRTKDVCKVKPLKDGLRLTFHSSGELLDPNKLLKDAGKRSKHLFIKLNAPVPETSIKAILLQLIPQTGAQ